MEKEIMDYNVTVFCKRCHRRLKDEEAKILGYGKVCYKKICSREHYYLFEMEKEK